jgi:antitoxin VapB
MSERKHVRLFRNGRNQAVRIPVEFELPGNEAIMHCDGDRLVIEAVRKRGLIALLKSMTALDEDFLRERQADRLVARDHVCACVGFAGGAAASGRG